MTAALRLAVAAAALQVAVAFLATPLNTSDTTVAAIFCPEQVTEVTRDHKWITREGIRRNLRQFFLDNPPPDNPSFQVPPSASLTEMYHAYYGAASSPARFIKAVNSIAAANVKADSDTQHRHDPAIQGDGEALGPLQDTMAARYPLILTSIQVDEAYPTARSLLGLSLHSLQKFYAHSTWIEQGNTVILSDLGLPGFVMDGLAGAAEDVCTTCGSPQGSCTDNVVGGAGLSSGYYQYDDPSADPFLIPKPATGGKCSHGGNLDDSATQEAQGGVNKDTAFPCFSPHHHLHLQAAELAVQATDRYLTVVLEVVGEDKYRLLFDLYHGSALSIAIDTTGSMSDDIDAVKQQVHEIVESSSAELYILAPFHDPDVGPGLKTTDPEEFLAAVDSLTAGGGAGGREERFWGGLQLALSLTPQYGDIFTFTDAGGNDGELMDSDIAWAQQQNNKVSIIYSGGDTSRQGDASTRESLTGVAEYQQLAAATGGLYIPSDKFDIEDITPILGEGVESASVDIVQLSDLQGVMQVQVPIDNSLYDFKVTIAGAVTSALLQDITGTQYDLMDEAGLSADPNIEVVAYSPTLKAVRWLAPRYGQWTLTTDSLTDLSVSVSGNSTLSWLGGFSILDPTPPHPHYRAAEGNPLLNTVYYVMVTLIGYLESDVTQVDVVEYLDQSGTMLRQIPYFGEVDDEFYIYSDPLPSQPFFMRLCGRVLSGNTFCRLLPVLVSTVETGVGVLATSQDLSALPGESTQADFLVINYGVDSYLDVSASDDKGFLTDLSPTSVYLTTNTSAVVTTFFTVPSTATPGTASTVVVTARSRAQPESVNSAISPFVVLSAVTDVSPPTCSMDSQPDCSNYLLSGLCLESNWTVQATLRDELSGLSRVEVKPEGLLTTVDDFTVGTTDAVSLTHWATCCTPQVDIIGVDSVGNLGKCQVDMGALGGVVLDLEVVSVGSSWVQLRWRITPSQYDLHRYLVVADDDYIIDNRCPEEVCHENVTYLTPCSVHTFTVTAYFTVNAEDYASQPASTAASTLDEEPSEPINGAVTGTTQTSANLTWEVADSTCSSLFQVCYESVEGGGELCEETETTSYVMQGLEPCVSYLATVTTLSPSGTTSQSSLTILVNTTDAAPGEPSELSATPESPYIVVLTWRDPLVRPKCAYIYRVEFLELPAVSVQAQTKMVTAKPQLSEDGYVSTVGNLNPCSNYTFHVSALSMSLLQGPHAVQYARTFEIEASPATNLTLDQVTATTIHASWNSDMTCVHSFLLCYYNELEVGEQCQETADKQTTLTNLLPCTLHQVAVSSYSLDGVPTNRTWQSATTRDVVPGAPENLTVATATAHSLHITFDPPTSNPQCAFIYDMLVVDGSVPSVAVHATPRLTDDIEGLQACSHYEVNLRSISSEGLQSDWAQTQGQTLEEGTSAPRNMQVLQVTNTTLTVTWWGPEVNERCVDMYEMEWTSSHGAQTEIITHPPDSSFPFEMEHTLSGLLPCTDYTVFVEAVTPLGAVSQPAFVTTTTLC